MPSLAVSLLCVHAGIVVVLSLFSPRRQTNDQFTIGERRVLGFGLTTSIFATLVTESLIFFGVTLTARYGPLPPHLPAFWDRVLG